MPDTRTLANNPAPEPIALTLLTQLLSILTTILCQATNTALPLLFFLQLPTPTYPQSTPAKPAMTGPHAGNNRLRCPLSASNSNKTQGRTLK